MSSTNTQDRIKVAIELTVLPGCPECGITWALPTDLVESKSSDGGFFCCPNGHQLRYKTKDSDEGSRALISRFRVWMVKAGHLIDCGITPSSPCTCGYEALLKDSMQ